MAYKLGMNCKAYFGGATLAAFYTGGASPTFTEMTNVKDVNLNLETGEADATTRGNNGWQQTLATLKKGSVEFEMNWDPSDAGFTALQTAWFSAGEVALAFMDGALATAGNQGLVSNFTVTNFSREEPLEEVVKVKVTVKPSSFTNWYTVPGA